jgi:hypothetical protein
MRITIANNYLRISENIFHQLREISLTTHETLYFQAFPSITSHEEIPWPQGKLSTHETSKPPRCQASKRLELPIKGEGDSIKRRKEEEAKEHGKHQISHAPSGNPFTYLKESITALESSLGLMNESLCLRSCAHHAMARWLT